jgi:hypothetical protein
MIKLRDRGREQDKAGERETRAHDVRVFPPVAQYRPVDSAVGPPRRAGSKPKKPAPKPVSRKSLSQKLFTGWVNSQ